MVLDRERGLVEQPDALGGHVVEVHVRELHGTEALDLAVLLGVWEDLGLSRLIQESLPDSEATVDAAWDVDVRLFDTAPLYGHGLSEQRLGRALARRPRDRFVVSTKVLAAGSRKLPWKSMSILLS